MESFEESLPEYIKYLFSPDAPVDFHFVIGNPSIGIPQRIGVLKGMLIARSPVMRKMMLESPLKHDSEVTVVDVEPDTFKHFLKFMYGLDLVSSLSVKNALKLLYIAEKYEVLDLKNRLSSVLKPKVSIDNVFLFLEYSAVCETVPELWAVIVRLIKLKTKEVFEHPKFITATLAAVIHIIEQDCMNVREIVVWKSALAWATYQITAADVMCTPERLREKMQPLMKYIRLCTMTAMEFNKEVVPTKILTYDEVCEICMSVSTKRNCIRSSFLNNQIEKRIASFYSGLKVCRWDHWEKRGSYECTSILHLHTRKSFVKLKSFLITGKFSSKNSHQGKQSYKIKGRIQVYKFIDYTNGTLSMPPRVIEIAEQAEYDQDLEISLENIALTLNPNSKYKITMFLESKAVYYINYDSDVLVKNEDLDITLDSCYNPYDDEDDFYYFCHLKSLKYLTVGYN